MTAGRAWLWGVAVVWASACATVPPRPESKVVDSLAIVGTQALTESEVKEKLATGESSWLPWWTPMFGRREWFDESTWQADLLRIRRVYEANGYHQVRIDEPRVEETRAGHVELSVKVTEGKPTRIASVEVRGLEDLPADHRAIALHRLPLRVGEVFREENWSGAKAQVDEELRELGYVEAVVGGEVVVDTDTATAAATVEVTPGRRYRVGSISVATAPDAEVPAPYISEHVAADVPAGAWYSESAVAQAQARLFQLGVFGAVKVSRAEPAREEGTVPILIAVREAPFRTTRLGGGLNLQSARQELRGVGEFTHRNLGLSSWFSPGAILDRLTLKARLGPAFLPNVVQVLCTEADACLPGLRASDAASWSLWVGEVAAEYQLPRFLNVRTLSFQTSLALRHALEPAYDALSGQVRLAVPWQPSLTVAVSPSLNLESYFITSLLPSTPQLGDTHPAFAIGCPTNAFCLLGYLDVALEWDRRDNKLEAREGTYSALSVQLGLSQTQKLTPYVRLVPEVRGYLRFGGEERPWTLAARLRAGTLLAPGNDTPIIARFFSGGSAMRGFSERRLSPMAAAPGGQLDALGNRLAEYRPIGGSGILETSLELRWNVTESLVLAAFGDAGAVSWEPLGTGPTTPYLAVGLGVRYRTPLAPIRLDVGIRLPTGRPLRVFPSEATDVTYPANGGCFFGLGYDGNPQYAGSPENLCAWHLTIGEAF